MSLLEDRKTGWPDAATIIVNWNTRELLRNCLTSLEQSKSDRLSQIVVVDNASSDGSAAMVRAEFPGVTLIQPGRNTGYAAGNNLGIQAVHEPYILLLNPDTEVTAGAIDRLARFLDDHPRCAVVAPQLFSPGGAVQRSCRGFPEPAALLAELTGIAQIWPSLSGYRMAGWNHDTERPVDQPMGSALMTRREAIDEAGLMDEQFPLFFNEVDWIYRIKKRGWEIWFTPTARILHHVGGSTRQIPLRSAWLSHTGLHAFYRKHYRSRLRPALYRVVIAAVYLHAAVVVALRGARHLVFRLRSAIS